MKFLAVTLALFALSAGVFGVDQQAKSKCRSIHHVDVDDSTAYANSGCVLNCVIHGKVQTHVASQGSACPLFPSGTCQSGQCIAKGPVARPKLGFVDVEMVSAQLANQANAYMGVCIQNSTAPVTLPIKDRSKCVSCTTNPISSRSPVWKAVCAQSGRQKFLNESRVSFEIFDHRGQGNNFFMGGATLTIPQMLNHGDNNREISLNMVGGNNAGSMKVRVTFTPTN